MELDEKHLNAHWASLDNDGQEFFIINEAIISKLCILGEDYEPCFEGASISNMQYSFDKNFKNQLFSMMNKIHDSLKGGTSVVNKYSVNAGESLINALEGFVADKYSIEDICEKDERQFAILKENGTENMFSVDFTFNEETNELVTEDIVEYSIEEEPVQEPVIDEPAAEPVVEGPVIDEPVLDNESDNTNSEEKEEELESSETIEEPEKEENEDKPAQYNLEEIQEYVELNSKYSELVAKYADLESANATLQEQVNNLTEFKENINHKEKEALIDSFYMLSDDDKKDVLENIDKYSLDDIEAKLSIICVRNKVSFGQEEEKANERSVSYNLNSDMQNDSDLPAWVKQVKSYSERKL